MLGIERGELLCYILSGIETAEQAAEHDRDQHKDDQRRKAYAAPFTAMRLARAAVLRGLRRIPFIPIVVLIQVRSLLSRVVWNYIGVVMVRVDFYGADSARRYAFVGIVGSNGVFRGNESQSLVCCEISIEDQFELSIVRI